MNRILSQLALAVATVAALAAQQTMPSTTLPSQLSKNYVGLIQLASYANVYPPGLPSPGGIGGGGGQSLTILYVDNEAMCVQGLRPAGVLVERGCQGTPSQNHAQGAKVWVGPSQWYAQSRNPSGFCIAAQQTVLPVIVIDSGTAWTCSNGIWIPYISMSVHRPQQQQGVFERLRTWIKKLKRKL